MRALLLMLLLASPGLARASECDGAAHFITPDSPAVVPIEGGRCASVLVRAPGVLRLRIVFLSDDGQELGRGEGPGEAFAERCDARVAVVRAYGGSAEVRIRVDYHEDARRQSARCLSGRAEGRSADLVEVARTRPASTSSNADVWIGRGWQDLGEGNIGVLEGGAGGRCFLAFVGAGVEVVRREHERDVRLVPLRLSVGDASAALCAPPGERVEVALRGESSMSEGDVDGSEEPRMVRWLAHPSAGGENPLLRTIARSVGARRYVTRLHGHWPDRVQRTMRFSEGCQQLIVVSPAPVRITLDTDRTRTQGIRGVGMFHHCGAAEARLEIRFSGREADVEIWEP